MPLQENFNKSGWLDIPDQWVSSSIKEASLQDISLPICRASWTSRMFPQQVKIFNLMQHANACIKYGDCVKDLTLILIVSNNIRFSSSCWWWIIDYYTFHEVYHLDCLKAGLGALVFSWDMLLMFPLLLIDKQFLAMEKAWSIIPYWSQIKIPTCPQVWSDL